AGECPRRWGSALRARGAEGSTSRPTRASRSGATLLLELLGQLDQPALHRGELLAHAADVGARRQVGQVPEALGDALDGGGRARLAAIEVGHEVEVDVAVNRRL